MVLTRRTLLQGVGAAAAVAAVPSAVAEAAAPKVPHLLVSNWRAFNAGSLARWLPGNRITSVFQDDIGSVWIGLADDATGRWADDGGALAGAPA